MATDIRQLLPTNVRAALLAGSAPSSINPYVTASALSSFGFVPYTGATANVDLGAFSLTSPTIYGSSASGGNLTLQSTSNATKGVIQIGTTDLVNIGNKVTTSQRLVRIGQGTAWMDLGNMVVSTSNPAIWFNTTTPSDSNYTLALVGSEVTLNTPNGGGIAFKHNNTSAGIINWNSWNPTPIAVTFGAYIPFNITIPSNTNQTLSTNIPNFKVTGANKQWATGTVANQYWNYLTANTASFVGASTMTNSFSLFVEESTAGTNATITNNWAAGFAGNVKVNKSLVIGNFTSTYTSAQSYYPLMVLGPIATGTIIPVQNTATNGLSQLQLANDQGNKFLDVAIYNSTFPTQGLRTANTAQISSDSAVKLLICNNTEINFIIGGGTSTNEIAKFVTGGLTFADAKNISFNTTTGTKIATATTQKLSFWNATPIVQPTTAVAAATLVSNAGTALTSTDTFDGYTLQQAVRALRNTGLLA